MTAMVLDMRVAHKSCVSTFLLAVLCITGAL